MESIIQFFNNVDQRLLTFTLGVLVFQLIYMVFQYVMTTQVEFLWYVFYLISAVALCFIIHLGEEAYKEPWERSLSGMIYSLCSFLSYWMFWKYLFEIKPVDGVIHKLIIATVVWFVFLIGFTFFVMLFPVIKPIYDLVFGFLSVVPQFMSIWLFIWTYRKRDKVLAGLLILGSVTANLLMMFPLLIFSNLVAGFPFNNGLSFLLLSYIVETTFLSIGLAHRTRQIFQRNKRLEIRIAETKMAALRAQMNPHFIYNSLNAINRFMLNEENEAASFYLTKFSRLIRAIFNHSRLDFIPLSDEVDTLHLYLEMESLRFRDKFTYDINIHSNIVPEQTFIPPMLIQPLVENSIYHGLFPKKEDRKVEVAFEIKIHQLKIIITDNGIGRKVANQLQLRNVMKEKSFGLQIVAERLLSLEETSGKKTGFEIIDLLDEQGNGSGTKVILTIPL